VIDNSDAKRGGTQGIDEALRERVVRDMAIFNDAMDAATDDSTSEILGELEQAADRLMRAVGRVLLEAKRLREREDRTP